jgi:PadR family transcriptional regulator, regulatory protein PadR
MTPHRRQGQESTGRGLTRRVTPSLACVLLLFLADPEREWYGAEMAVRLRCHSSTVGRILTALRGTGWATDRESRAHPGPVRYYHRLTATGVVEAKRALHRQYPSARRAQLAEVAGLSIDDIDLDLPEGDT